jgi:type II secretion system protein N
VGKKRAWFGYGVFAALVAVCALYFRFPAVEVGDYLDRSIKGINPALSFAAATIKPWPPLLLRFTDMKVVSTGADDPLLVADNLVAGPQIRSLVQGKKPVYVFKGKAYGGEFDGRLQLHSDTAQPGSASLSFNGIDLAKYKYFSELLGRHIEGILGGSVDFQTATDRLLGGDGRTKLRVTDGRVELLQPLFGLDAIGFNDLTVEAELANGVLTANMEFDGPEIRGTVSGTVRVLADIGQSRLALKGAIEPQAQLEQQHPQAAAAFNLLKKKMKNGRYSFAVSGTVQQPKFSIL